MKINVRQGSWIVTVPLAATALAYIMLCFLPGRRAIGEARNQVAQKQAYIARAAGLATTLRAAQQELGKTQTYNMAWREHAPAQGELSALYAKIHALAKIAGVATTRFDPEPVIRRDTIRMIPVSMGCVGRFAEICEFLRQLENLPVVIWISSLHVGETTQNGDSVPCEISLAIFTDNQENSDYVRQSE